MSDRMSARLACVLVTTIALTTMVTGAHAGERWHWSLTPSIWASDISEDLIRER